VSPRVPRTTHRASLGAAHVGLNRLTPRQQQIVLLLGEGKSSVEVARLLHLGPSTITFHRKNIMRILGLDSEGSLLRFAVLVRAGAIDANVVPT
jgi:DNA-binding CsgD family transcriptional regulator